jgi:tetraacyldisaccharide 4'-kinase
LRDEKKSVERADIIIVTKCKPGLSLQERQAIVEELGPTTRQAVFFTSIRYGQPYHILSKQTAQVSPEVEVLLVTGIANPGPLKALLQEKSGAYYQLAYNDHHIFTIDDLKDIQKRFGSISANKKIILTTEKDAVRLVKFEQALAAMPLYVVPIELEFLFNEAPRFNGLIGTFIKDFSINHVKANV